MWTRAVWAVALCFSGVTFGHPVIDQQAGTISAISASLTPSPAKARLVGVTEKISVFDIGENAHVFSAPVQIGLQRGILGANYESLMCWKPEEFLDHGFAADRMNVGVIRIIRHGFQFDCWLLGQQPSQPNLCWIEWGLSSISEFEIDYLMKIINKQIAGTDPATLEWVVSGEDRWHVTTNDGELEAYCGTRAERRRVGGYLCDPDRCVHFTRLTLGRFFKMGELALARPPQITSGLPKAYGRYGQNDREYGDDALVVMFEPSVRPTKKDETSTEERGAGLLLIIVFDVVVLLWAYQAGSRD